MNRSSLKRGDERERFQRDELSVTRLEGELNGRRDDALLVAPQGLVDGPVCALERNERKVALFRGLDSAADAER